ncbi:MAG: aminoglycoside phosphotransferase family protein [Alphaproteobacteria bacterium]|nr:aminoglycoside phosphotransferase family protein [Alphaproteobacteria bacterium]
MITLDEAQNYTFVKKVIQACKPNLPVFRLEKLNGNENFTYMVNDTTVVRFFKNSFIEKQIEYQQEILNFLASRVPYPISQFSIHYGEYQNKQQTMCVMPRIEGHVLGEEKFSQLPRTTKQYIFDQLSVFLKSLHTINPKDMTQFKIPFMEDQLARRFQTHPLYSLISNCLSVFHNRKTLCHCDLNPRNYHVNSSYQITGIFDFDTLSFANPVFDIALYPRYSQQDSYLFKKMYEDKTKSNLDYFDGALMLRMLFIMSYIQQDLKSQKGQFLCRKIEQYFSQIQQNNIVKEYS